MSDFKETLAELEAFVLESIGTLIGETMDMNVNNYDMENAYSIDKAETERAQIAYRLHELSLRVYAKLADFEVLEESLKNLHLDFMVQYSDEFPKVYGADRDIYNHKATQEFEAREGFSMSSIKSIRSRFDQLEKQLDLHHSRLSKLYFQFRDKKNHLSNLAKTRPSGEALDPQAAEEFPDIAGPHPTQAKMPKVKVTPAPFPNVPPPAQQPPSLPPGFTN